MVGAKKQVQNISLAYLLGGYAFFLEVIDILSGGRVFVLKYLGRGAHVGILVSHSIKNKNNEWN